MEEYNNFFYLFFDTETNARTEKNKFTYRQHVMQISYTITDKDFKVLKQNTDFIKDIAKKTYEHATISLDDIKNGQIWNDFFNDFLKDIRIINKNKGKIIAHNLKFDRKVIEYSCKTKKINSEEFSNIIQDNGYCTMTEQKSINHCKLPGKFGYKWPKLEELYKILYNTNIIQTHFANDDVNLLIDCYKKGKEIKIFN